MKGNNNNINININTGDETKNNATSPQKESSLSKLGIVIGIIASLITIYIFFYEEIMKVVKA